MRPFLFEDPAAGVRRRRRRRRLLLALGVAMLGLAGGAVASRVLRHRAMERGYVESMAADLRELAAAQSRYRQAVGRYATIADLGIEYVPSQGIVVRVTRADEHGWAATASHDRTPVSCTVAVGVGPAGGEPACRR